MTTNSLFIWSLVLIMVMSIFVVKLAPDAVVDFDIGDDPTAIGAPDVWDVLLFAAGTFWAMMTFSIQGLPWIFGVFFWFIVMINLWCAVRLIRGVS